MTLAVDDPRSLAAPGTGGTALRWGLAASTVVIAYAGAVWLALALPAPEGAQGELQDAVMIELEPLTAIEEAPPPAPEPEVVEEVAPEPTPAPVEPLPPPEPVEEIAPEPPPPEPVVEDVPPPPEPVVPPEPIVEEPPPPPEPVEAPKPLPEPTTQEVVPDPIETDTIAAAVLNPPVPKLRPPPPRPVEKAQAKPKVEKPRRKAEPEKKPERPRRVETARTPPPRASAARSDAPAASRSASAPRVSSASWQRLAVGHFRKFRRVAATSARGTARVSLTIDRGGRVLSASLASSSGDAVLDREAVALVRRASPIPAPPEGVGGRTIPLTIPINLR